MSETNLNYTHTRTHTHTHTHTLTHIHAHTHTHTHSHMLRDKCTQTLEAEETKKNKTFEILKTFLHFSAQKWIE